MFPGPGSMTAGISPSEFANLTYPQLNALLEKSGKDKPSNQSEAEPYFGDAYELMKKMQEEYHADRSSSTTSD